MQIITVGGVSVTEHTAVAVKPQHPASPLVATILTAAPKLAIASRKSGLACFSSDIFYSYCQTSHLWASSLKITIS